MFNAFYDSDERTLIDKHGKPLMIGDCIDDGNGPRVILRDSVGMLGLIECADLLFPDDDSDNIEYDFDHPSYLTRSEIESQFERF